MLKILIFLFSFHALFASESLIINVICDDNGVGLSSDLIILYEELTKLGHIVNIVDTRFKPPKLDFSDINIFIEHPIASLFDFADKNYFIPNPEWCKATEEMIQKFDLILCRTREVERIFHPINPNTYYLGFTSIDRYDETEYKSFDQFLHLRGRSVAKGTYTIYNLWQKRPDFPTLYILSNKTRNHNMRNVKINSTYLSTEELIQILNRCGVHLCPSETEGFGHYITEAMSTGAVVVTTNAPPMNEFIKDERCLVNYNKTSPNNYATNYYVDLEDFENVIDNLLSLPREELVKIGMENRRRYLKNRQDFIGRLAALFGDAFGNLGIANNEDKV